MTSHAAHKAHHDKPHHPHEKPHHPHFPLAGLLFAFVFALGVYSVHEPSTWIHIKTGAKILAARGIPSTDSFSYTMGGRPWTTSSWLSDVLFFLIHRSFGTQGLILFKSAVAALAFSLLLPINPASPLTAATILGLGALASWTGFTERPAVFDLLMLALLVRVLRLRKPFHWKLVVQVAAVELLWANLHGTRAVIGVWMALLKTFKTSLRTAQKERLRHAAILAAAVVGLSLNPLGFHLVGHTFSGLGSFGSTWRPLSPWLNLYGAFAAAGLVSCVVCLQQEFFLTVTAATLLVFSMLVPSLRPLYMLAVCPVLTLAAGHVLASKPINAARFGRWAALMAVFFWLHWAGVYAPLGRWRGYGAASLDGALRFMKENGVRGRLFNEVESGPEIMAKSDRLVFVDPRASLYEPAFLRDAARWASSLSLLTDVYRFDYALVLNRRAAYPARAFDSDPDWRLAYADDAALVYLRRLGADSMLVPSLPVRLLSANRLWPDSLEDLLKQPPLKPKVLAELDRWVLEAPDATQPLLWKAYALDRLNLADKAERWIAMAEARPALKRDPELMCAQALFYAKRSDWARAEKILLTAADVAGRRGDAGLEGQVLQRLSWVASQRGQPERARAYDDRAAALSSGPAED